ncbi:hypothetical protein [Actinoplanes sp. NPDC020271]|uniref:hypothetical protein n=1 Tax=Actinoplanes sp. NPDC020271 TaxID=3363896 RepID=UPI00379D32DF
MLKKKSVIGYDGSPDDRAALARASDEAERPGTPDEACSADEWAATPCLFPILVPPPKDHLAEAVREMLDHSLDQARRAEPS